MSLNLRCWNSRCQFYFEDLCTKHIGNGLIKLNKDGKCTDFSEGKSDWYELENEYLEKFEEVFKRSKKQENTTELLEVQDAK